MKLQEALLRMKSLNCQAAVVDELIAYAQKALDKDFEIPVDSDPGVADEASIEIVLERLLVWKEKLIEQLEVASELEVADGAEFDSDPYE